MFAFTYRLNLSYLVILLTVIQISGSAILKKRSVSVEGLYSVEDNVVILTVENFKSEIYGSNKAWLVEFYNSWCGFCQRFAPIFKSFAGDIKNWKDLVTVGVIDCSKEANDPICTEFEVVRYPTLKYFSEDYNEGSKTYGVKVMTAFDKEQLSRNLINVMIHEQATGNGKLLPNLQPFNSSNLSDVLITNSKMPTYGFIIIQPPSDTIGPEAILDFHKFNNITVRYILNNNSELLKNLNFDSKLSLYVIEKNEQQPEILTVYSPDREGIKRTIELFLYSKNITYTQDLDKLDLPTNLINKTSNLKGNLKLEQLRQEIKKMGDTVFQGDLESALRYSLKREIGSRKEITKEELESLKKYIQVLKQYFPFNNNGQKLLIQIGNYTENKKNVSGIDIRKMVVQAEDVYNKVFSTPQQWLACLGSSPLYRGYPCGLWKMFHYLTVNAANDGSALEQSKSNFVLETMFGYIKYFFGCKECSEHFQKMAAKRGIFNVSSPDDSILWLWEAHNEVNERLHRDLTEDPEYPKIQFPSEHNCPQCYTGDKTWKKAEVLKYLKHIYNKNNIKFIEGNPEALTMLTNSAKPLKCISITLITFVLTMKVLSYL